MHLCYFSRLMKDLTIIVPVFNEVDTFERIVLDLSMMSSYFFSANPGPVNDTRKIAHWISDNHLL